MSLITTSDIADDLKETLDEIMTDRDDNLEETNDIKRYYTQENMPDNWVEDQEVAGPGLATETNEGEEIPVGVVRTGYIKRYTARKYAIKLVVTDEALEDNKYEQAIKAARRCKRSMFKSMRVDGALTLARAFNTAFPGPDGVALASASHPLAKGGTASNTLATPLSPSRVALQTMITNCAQLPSQDGIKEGYEVKKVLCPINQRFIWAEILRSEYAPEAGEFNRINVINRDFDIELVPLLFWDNTTTNWGVQTDAEEGFKWKWRRRPRSGSWVDNDRETVKYKQSARWDRGYSDWRSFYGSEI